MWEFAKHTSGRGAFQAEERAEAKASVRNAPAGNGGWIVCKIDKVRGPDRLVAGFATARNSSRLRPLSQRVTWVPTNVLTTGNQKGQLKSFY